MSVASKQELTQKELRMTAVIGTNHEDLEYRFLWALGLSLLIHTLLFTFIQLSPNKVKQDNLVQITLRELPPEMLRMPRSAPETKKEEKQEAPKLESRLPPTQIVSTPQSKEQEPLATTKLSEKNSRAEQEMIRRGVENAKLQKTKPSSPTPASSPPAAAETKADQTGQATKLARVGPARLRLNDQEIALGLAKNRSAIPTKPLDKSLSGSPDNNLQEALSSPLAKGYQPFSHSSPATALNERLGVSDYLPNIPDGDITLLNTKANHFAVFVRRVANQVFGVLRRTSWAELPYSEVRRIKQFATIKVKLSKSGELLAVNFINNSGSPLFDNALSSSVRSGAWDKNPPAGAQAEDGFIYFIFQARTWSRPPVGGMREQRWILLGTGLL